MNFRRKRKKQGGQPNINVKQIGPDLFAVYVCYYVRGEKKELRGKTRGQSIQEVKKRAITWVQEELKKEAQQYAAQMLTRRQRTADHVKRSIGI